MRGMKKISCVILAVMAVFSCIKPFNPPAISAANLNLLVVDGFIVPGSASTIKLSRTLNITDSFQVVPELNAQLYLEGSSGSIIPFQAGVDNSYTCPTGFLSPDDQYRLRIILQNGSEYLSDFVEVKQSPPIDTLEWDDKDGDVTIYISTHDPTARAKYYKWEYDETIEYRAAYEALVDWVDNQFVFLEPDELRYQCYKFYNSTNIVIGNSSALSDDVIRRLRVTVIPGFDEKLSYRYSILVKQYSLTADAYKYWQILQANTEQNGNLFDPQPAQLRSNIHNTGNPGEPVVGYLSISSFTEKRIFIRNSQLRHPSTPPFFSDCKETFIDPSLAAQYLNGTEMKPAYFSRSQGLAIAPAFCVDCRLRGGTTQKPPYW
ncbi:MAG: DUF4249 domain-containing protein [Chitinophagaceae bacterium]|nr:DUF4249 domain-containing protein [Chitinophagaceae bacterium]